MHLPFYVHLSQLQPRGLEFLREISPQKIFGSPFPKWTINADRSWDGIAVKINPFDAEISFLAKYEIQMFTSSQIQCRTYLGGKGGKEGEREKATEEEGGRGKGRGRSGAIELALVKGTAYPVCCCSCPICYC